MRATSPESSDFTSRFWLRTLCISVNEARDLELLRRKDIEWEKVGKAVVLLGTEGVENRIV
jgi:hypothetical protein